MDPAVALLIFVVAAVATVVTSLVIQQHYSKTSNDVPDPRQLEDLAERRPSEDAGWNPIVRDDRSPTTPEDELRMAKAEQLEEVADRERRYAEHAEAEARRLRESDNGTLGPAPRDQRARRAGVAPDDLDY